MRVIWQEWYFPHHAEDYEDFHPLPPTTYAGEVIGTVRVWGETRLVVMLDSGDTREVAASKVKKAE
jgi:hypothetical protein